MSGDAVKPPVPAIRFCKDCRWAARGLVDQVFGWRYARCARPDVTGKYRAEFAVSGEGPEIEYPPCSVERSDLKFLNNHCGKDAKFFEARDP